MAVKYIINSMRDMILKPKKGYDVFAELKKERRD